MNASFHYSTHPEHKHDCACCTFVGGLYNAATGERRDIYLHGNMETGTLICRTGSEGADYHSCAMELLNHHVPVGDEMSRALHLLRAKF